MTTEINKHCIQNVETKLILISFSMRKKSFYSHLIPYTYSTALPISNFFGYITL